MVSNLMRRRLLFKPRRYCSVMAASCSQSWRKDSRTPRPGGLTYTQRPHAKCEKIF